MDEGAVDLATQGGLGLLCHKRTLIVVSAYGHQGMLYHLVVLRKILMNLG